MKFRDGIDESAGSGRSLRRAIAPTGLVLALLALAAEALAGFGTRLGWWHYRTGLVIFGLAGIAGAAGAIVSLIGGIFAGRRFAFRIAAAGIVIGLTATGILWAWSGTGQEMPKIHDISTDTLDPPQFAAIIPLRKNAENPPQYGGPKVAAQQALAYPDLQPLILPIRQDAAYERALKTARDMRWEIVSAAERDGRIEATATTFWFGFKDDVVVRISPAKNGSRIDVRSASRVGVSDVGTNARRIRTFLHKMKSGD